MVSKGESVNSDSWHRQWHNHLPEVTTDRTKGHHAHTKVKISKDILNMADTRVQNTRSTLRTKGHHTKGKLCAYQSEKYLKISPICSTLGQLYSVHDLSYKRKAVCTYQSENNLLLPIWSRLGWVSQLWCTSGEQDIRGTYHAKESYLRIPKWKSKDSCCCQYGQGLCESLNWVHDTRGT